MEKTLLYFKKPDIGGNIATYDSDNKPIQIQFPNGALGIGISSSSANSSNAELQASGIITMASANESNPSDMMYLRGLEALIYGTCFINLVITCLLYANASTSDVSKSSAYVGSPYIFGHIPKHRTPEQGVNFGFTLLILLLGGISTFFQSSLGLASYSLAITLNFVLGTFSLPNFVYASRYVLDLFMLYLVFLYRKRLGVAFLSADVGLATIPNN